MRMIARILDCPFHLSIMSEVQAQPRSTAALEQAAIARTEAVEEAAAATAVSEERDMTIGELYEIHQELSELEENAKAGEPVEEIKKELEKPKKERFPTGGIFRRRKTEEEARPGAETKEETQDTRTAAGPVEPDVKSGQPADDVKENREEDFEPVISYNDVQEDLEAGEVNPYTGREYQSNSVRMHPTRIGYVQVYDRTIHKWTDMTEWAFLGLQERKKALLGKSYEPPIYLD